MRGETIITHAFFGTPRDANKSPSKIQQLTMVAMQTMEQAILMQYEGEKRVHKKRCV